MDSEIRYVAATGALGVGVHVESLGKSLEMEPAFIPASAGTTDAGPCIDPAHSASIQILGGFPSGFSWHGGKVVEGGTRACGGERGGVLTATIRHYEAILRPIGPGLRCTPQSIAAHSLYENAHPYLHKECAGTLDLTNSRYEAIDASSVRITQSEFIPAADYTVKLEGAELI